MSFSGLSPAGVVESPEPAQHVETIRCSSYHTGHVLPPGKMVVQDHDKLLEGVNYLEWVGADGELGWWYSCS